MDADTTVSSQDLDASASMEQVLNRSILPKNKLAIILETDEGTLFCCVQCPMRFETKEKLELHLCLHFKEFRFLCGICGTGLKRKEHLDRHLLGHQGVRPHVCPECGKGFKRKEHLNIHRSIHSGDKTQVCSLCQRSFYRKDHLQKHLQTHNKIFMEQNIYPLSDSELMDIKQEVTVDDDEDVKPDINGDMEEVEMEETPRIPSPVQSSDPLRPYACPICNKTYKRKDHLKLHSQTHLKKEQTCSECGKGFHREEQLLTHMSIHLRSYQLSVKNEEPTDMQDMVDNTSVDILPMEASSLLLARQESRPHECAVCRRKFKRKQHLKVHANVHLKMQAPTIWCSLCNEGFVTNAQFEGHQCFNGHHDEDIAGEGEREGGTEAETGEEGEGAIYDAKKENDYPEQMPMMLPEESFKEYSEQHIEYSEQHIPTPLRVFVCKYCSKPFKRKDHYRIHLHIHTGVKSFFCPECGKGFYRKDHLQKHMQVHLKQMKPKPKRELPDLYPISMVPRKKEILPEITITAPSNAKLRVPLQIKVPYQVVMAMDNGEQRAVTIDPQTNRHTLSQPSLY